MVRGLVRATHPEATVAVTLITTVLAVAVGRGWEAGWVAAAVLAGQASVGWSNDWLDAARDRAAGRVDKPTVRGIVPVPTLRRAATAALGLAVALSLVSGLPATAAHAVALALAWSYNLNLKLRLTSVLAYAGAFAMLPLFVTLGLPGRLLPPWWAVGAAALLGAGAHCTQALPDLSSDAEMGVRGFPQRLGPRKSLLVAAALLGAGTLVVVLGPAGPPGASARALLVLALVLVGAVVAAGLAGRQRLAFPLTLATAGVTVVALLRSGASLVP